MSSKPCRTETALTSNGLGKRIRLLKSNGRDPGEDQLGDSVSMSHGLLARSEIDQQDAHFAPVVAIDRSGAVEN